MRRVLFHHILLVILMGLVILLFTSCTTILPPETGIVTITVEIESTVIMNADLERPVESYYIYMDDLYQGIITGSGALTLEDVPLGIYTFEASNNLMAGIPFDRNSSIDLQEDSPEKLNGFTCYGSIVYEVKPEVNYVEIPVSCGYWEAME
jgi:hypothetical protein